MKEQTLANQEKKPTQKGRNRKRKNLQKKNPDGNITDGKRMHYPDN